MREDLRYEPYGDPHAAGIGEMGFWSICGIEFPNPLMHCLPILLT